MRLFFYGCSKQDFGRVCRYRKKGEADSMLPRLLLSSELKKITLETNKRKTRSDTTSGKDRKRFKTSGLFNITPDFNNKMRFSKKGKKSEALVEGDESGEGILPLSSRKPMDDHDIRSYSSHWAAGRNHYDFENSEKYANRFLLYGRPQLGKTGVLLQTGFLIYRKIGSPKHTGPHFDNVILEELELEDDNDEDIKDGIPEHCEEYPVASHIRNLSFIKPQPSKRYGDPNDPDVMEYYKSGANSVHKSVLSAGNKIYQRTEVASKTSDPRKEEEYESDLSVPNSTVLEEVYSKFISKPLKKDSKKEPFDYACYPIHDNMFEKKQLGVLHVNKSRVSMKHWNLDEGGATLDRNLKFPLIMIPSRGRAATGLLDLTLQMENSEEYVQVVVLHSKDPDLENYKQHLNCYPQISFFIIDGTLPLKVGSSRYACKVLAEHLALAIHHPNPYVLVMDDNILHFDGVTLINDPHPQFGEESRWDRSQRTHISLLSIMKHFSNKNLEDKMSQFSAIGFSNNYDKKENKKKHAYSRQHVFAAVFLNLNKLCDIDYLQQMFAMEDIEFLNRVNSSSVDNTPKERGLIVKCKRFVTIKKKFDHGGVVMLPEHMRECKNDISRRAEARKRSIEEGASTPSKKARDTIPITQFFPSPRKPSPVRVSENIAPDSSPPPRMVEPELEKSFSANASGETGDNQGGENIQILENSTDRSFDIIALESESSSIDDRIKIESSTSASEGNKLSPFDKAVQLCTKQKLIIKKQKEEISRLKNKLAEKEKVERVLKRKLAEYEEKERKEKEDQEEVLNSIMSDDSE